jgi:hypothetical protein
VKIGFWGGNRGFWGLNNVRCRGGVVCYIPATSRPSGEAEMAHETDYKPGSMDISQHIKSYHSFLTASKWTFGFVLLLMVFLAIFRTNG